MESDVAQRCTGADERLSVFVTPYNRRLGITREQADLMRLPTNSTKDRRGGFQGDTVEAEAMPAGDQSRRPGGGQ